MSETKTIEVEHAPEAKQRYGPRFDLNSIATIGAVILSIVAISISVLEVSTMRTHQRASVWPYLEISQSYSSQNSSQDKFAITLRNKGVGPALIKDFALLLDEEPAYELDQLIIDVAGEANAFSYDIYRTSNPSNGVISPREDVNLLSFPITSETNVFLNNAQGRVDIRACYCSIHDQCWSTRLSANEPTEVDACK